MIYCIYTDHIHQISWAHWQTPTLHDLVYLLEISPFRNHNFQTKEHRKEHAIDQETRTVINHNRLFTQAQSIGTYCSYGFVGGVFTANNFNQGHRVNGVKEVHTTEVLRTF